MVVPPNTVHSSTFEEEYERIYINGEFNKIFNLNFPAVILDNPQEEGTLLAKMIYRNRYAGGEYVSALSMAFAQFLVQNLKNDSEISLAVKEIVNTITDSFIKSPFITKACVPIVNLSPEFSKFLVVTFIKPFSVLIFAGVSKL